MSVPELGDRPEKNASEKEVFSRSPKTQSPAAANDEANCDFETVSGRDKANHSEAQSKRQFAVRDPAGMLASRAFRRPRGVGRRGKDCTPDQEGHSGQQFAPPNSGEASNQPATPIRQKRRAAEWHSAAYRAAHDLKRQHQDRANEIDAGLARELAEGPDFARCHRGSLFLDAPRNNLDRNFIARVWFVAQMIERKSWACRAKGKHGGTLGTVAIEVLRTLLFVIKKVDGRLYPSLETLATLSRKSKQAVVTAIKVLERMGFVTVHKRIKRIRTPMGTKVVQDSNAYQFHLPIKGLGALAMAVFCPRASESTKSDAIRTSYKTTGGSERGEAQRGLPMKEADDRWWLHAPLPTGSGGYR
jgi:hypothetical protein